MESVITEEKRQSLHESIETHLKKPGPLMPVLQDAQNIFGCVPLEVQKIIAEKLDVSVSKINGVVTFYGQFSLKPKGKNIISVCMGTACYVRGGKGILDTFCDELGIGVGETTKDGQFTIEETRCLGACGLAPVFTVNGKVHGNGTVQKAKKLLKDMKS